MKRFDVRVRWPRLVAVVSVALTILVSTAQPALAEENLKVSSHYSSTAPTIVNFTCPERQDAIATYPMAGTITYGNDSNDNFIGKGDFTSCVYVMEDGSSEYTTKEVFTGSIKRCGKGSVVIMIKGTTSAPDAVTGNRHSHGTWRIVPGSGTGDLKQVSGTGIEDSIADPQSNVNGLFTGNISCSC